LLIFFYQTCILENMHLDIKNLKKKKKKKKKEEEEEEEKNIKNGLNLRDEL
jgi:hypothetical protein